MVNPPQLPVPRLLQTLVLPVVAIPTTPKRHSVSNVGYISTLDLMSVPGLDPSQVQPGLADDGQVSTPTDSTLDVS